MSSFGLVKLRWGLPLVLVACPDSELALSLQRGDLLAKWSVDTGRRLPANYAVHRAGYGRGLRDQQPGEGGRGWCCVLRRRR